jgi:xanthine dehydrogenase YagR molybdenum-binding subunit
VLARTVADVFGIPPEAVTVSVGDSRLVRATMSSGSRTTASVAPAAEAAARAVRVALGRAATQRLGAGDPVIDAAGFRTASGVVPWAEIIAVADDVEVTMKRPPDPGGDVLPVALDGFTLARARPVSAHVCEVEVDSKTGRIRVLRVSTALAVGRVRAEALARSQVIGGAIQGVSYALYEERRLDPNTGRTVTQCLDDHRLCGLADAPEVDVAFVGVDFDTIAGGSAGLGELSTLAVASAIGNAVFDATGWRPTELPLRIERVVTALAALRSGVH